MKSAKSVKAWKSPAAQAEWPDRETDRRDVIEWLADWGRDARKRQTGLLLLSAHRAKGLEFDDVVVLDGDWDRPSNGEDKDAERRLYYVAMTRARRSLALISMGARHPFLDGLDGPAVAHRALDGKGLDVADCRMVYQTADDLKVRRAEAGAARMRGFASFDYAAGSWRRKRRVVARLEATTRGFDARYIVTSLEGGPRHLYEGIYCTRGQAENLIKQHKAQLASDRTSCQSPLANQFRLILHTSAYWLMLALRDAVPRRMPLAWSEFATIRRSLLKIGARVVEKAARIRIHFASACPDAALFRMLAGRLAASGP